MENEHALLKLQDKELPNPSKEVCCANVGLSTTVKPTDDIEISLNLIYQVEWVGHSSTTYCSVRHISLEKQRNHFSLYVDIGTIMKPAPAFPLAVGDNEVTILNIFNCPQRIIVKRIHPHILSKGVCM